MRRRLFTILSVLSLLVCAISLGLWTHSVWYDAMITVGRRTCSDGVLTL
jgi:hypothetical protein